jgi:two-component system nitrogen regulation sensor histidine kinase GlnL
VQDAESRRYIEVIDAECARLLALVERLLDPALPAVVEPVNVHALLERVRMLAEAEAGWAIRIERDYDPSLPDLHGDPARLTQALLNLVRNALQAGAAEVRLRTRAEHNVPIGEIVHRLAIRIEVADSGRGVPDELNERIFLPLVSGHAEGSGLGLPLAQQIAREHGGSVGFRSRPGHTVFTLLLPVREPAPAEQAGPGAAAGTDAAHVHAPVAAPAPEPGIHHG